MSEELATLMRDLGRVAPASANYDFARKCLEAITTLSVDASNAQLRVGVLERQVARYRAGVLKAFDGLCDQCRGAATVPDDVRQTLEDR